MEDHFIFLELLSPCIIILFFVLYVHEDSFCPFLFIFLNDKI